MEYVLSLFLIAASSAPPEACNRYAARDYPSIKLEEHEKTITVVYDAWNDTYEKVIAKTFGALLEGAVGEDGKTFHVFARTTVDGQPAMIFSSIVFFQDCPKGHK